MLTHNQGNPSAIADIGKITPDQINPQLFKDISKLIEPVISTNLPKKRSGFGNVVFIIFQACIQLLTLCPEETAKWFEKKCQDENIWFQSFLTKSFSNNKTRRHFPDQPAYSRYLARIDALGCMEEFWNLALLAHALYLRSIGLLKTDIKLIADYTKELCKKDKLDPYCFGTKEGKTVHKTLTFSIISGDLHQIIANFKIKKRQDKLPIFEKIIDCLKSNGFNIVYELVDREFYTKQLMMCFKKHEFTVIMPGRKCNQTKTKITRYLLNKGKRYCRGFTKLAYVRKKGYPKLRFDLLLVAKRKYSLKSTKQNLKSKKITIDEAKKRIFPLIILYGKNGGIKTLHGNESYIRDLYRQRWIIEIAFREMNRLGISNRSQNRNLRLGVMGAKSLLYNMWQVQRQLIQKSDPSAEPLKLDEFLGKCVNKRYPAYIA